MKIRLNSDVNFVLEKKFTGIRPEFDVDFESIIHKAFVILHFPRRSMVQISSDNFSLPIDDFDFDFDVNFQLGKKNGPDFD